MKINLAGRLREVDGTEVIVDSKPLTLADVFKTSVLTVVKEDEGESADQKLWKWNMANDIHKNKDGEIDITPEDLVKLKERVLKVYPAPIVYGNVCNLTDPKEK